MQIQDFMTYDSIGSYVGTIFVTMLVVQFLKELPYIKKIPTKYFTFLIAFTTILISSIHSNTFSLDNLYLMLINAIIITLTATGGYDFTFKKVSVSEEPKEGAQQ